MTNTKFYKVMMKKNGLNPTLLNKLLEDPVFQNLTFKGKCEWLNSKNLTFGHVRCCSPVLLDRHLGIDMCKVIQIGISVMNYSLESNKSPETESFIWNSVFNIDSIRKGKVMDFGFFHDQKTKSEMEQIDSRINDVIDEDIIIPTDLPFIMKFKESSSPESVL